MKSLIIIAALIAATLTAHAEGEKHLLVAVSVETWQDASPIKRDKIKTFFERFVTEGHGVTPQARYTHTTSGKEIMVACYDRSKLVGRNGEDITDEKIADVNARLADNQIRIEPTDNPHATLAAWGLAAPESELP